MNPCALGCTTRDGDPFPAPEGYQICDRCVLRVRETINDIVTRYTAVLSLWASLPAAEATDRAAPGFHSSPPGDIHMMALRDPRTVAIEPGDLRSAIEVLHAWARILRGHRGLSAPAEPITVDSESATLLFHADWIYREWRPAVIRNYVTELSETRGQLLAVTRIDDPPRIVGRCTNRVDGQRCNTTLYVPRHGAMIRCGRCPATYDGAKLITLALQVHEEIDSERGA